MKTILSFVCAALLLAACNNAGRSDENNADSLNTNNDSLNTMDNTDVNNRNTTGYDSAARKGDTASYERMQEVKTDSPRH